MEPVSELRIRVRGRHVQAGKRTLHRAWLGLLGPWTQPDFNRGAQMRGLLRIEVLGFWEALGMLGIVDVVGSARLWDEGSGYFQERLR